ncbi:MAG: proline/glycine betaine ABC transporter permease, partial [Mycetocola sp.]
MDFRIPLGDWAEEVVSWVTTTLGGLFDFIRAVAAGIYDGVDFALSTPPFYVIILLAAILAFFARGWVFALGSVIGLLVIVGVDQWDNAMDTLALVLVASVIAIAISIPLG